jgi:hypothetical protein
VHILSPPRREEKSDEKAKGNFLHQSPMESHLLQVMAKLGDFEIGKPYRIELGKSIERLRQNGSELNKDITEDTLICLSYRFKPPLDQNHDGVAIVDKDKKWNVKFKGKSFGGVSKSSISSTEKMEHFQGVENAHTNPPECLLIWHKLKKADKGEGKDGKFVLERVEKYIHMAHNANIDSESASTRTAANSMIAGQSQERKRPMTDIEKIVSRKPSQRQKR